MKNKNFIIKYRWIIIIATLFCVAVCTVLLTKIQINPDFESYLPESMHSIQNDHIINEMTGNEEPLLIVVEAEDVLNSACLQRIKNLSDEFSQMPAFDRVFSLFQAKSITNENGSMVIEPLIQQIPQNEYEKEELRNNLKSNELVWERVVSNDCRYSLIMLVSNKTMPDKELIETINSTINKYPGKERILLSGQPVLRDEAGRKIARDIMILLPLGLLLMLVLLWISFRELKGVLLPFSVVVFSIIISMALIPLLGWKLSLLGILIPVMMLSIANNYGVYFIARYQDLNANNPKLTMKSIVRQSFSYLYKPILFCGLTTIAGIAGLIVHLLIPARQTGIVSAIGICFALIVSLLFAPAVLSTLKKGKPHHHLSNETAGFFMPILVNTGKLVTRSSKKVIISFIIILSICASGLAFFNVSPDSNDVLPMKNQFNEAIKIVDKHLGGSKIITILVEGDALNPDLLKKLEQYENELIKSPTIGSVTSLATIIKEMSKALNSSDDKAYNKIPESREAIAQYIELYSMSGNPEDMEQFINIDYNKTLLTIQYKATRLAEIDNILYQLKKLGENSIYTQVIGGYSLVEKEMSESIISGQYYSLIFAFAVIFLLMSIIFKSTKAGIIGSLPLVFAVVCTFGLMGWLRLELNMVSALLSSISIGLGVDFTIQVFWRIKWELAKGNDYFNSVSITLKTIGRGIIINAFAVILGFSVLLFSAFPLVQSFGFLIILSLFLCLICSLVLIPSICLVLKPEFLHNPTKQTNRNIKLIAEPRDSNRIQIDENQKKQIL